MSKIKSANKEIMVITCVAVGVITAIVITLLLAATAGIFINNEYFEPGIVPVLAAIIQGVSAFIGALVGGRLSLTKKILSSILVAGGYCFLLLCIAALIFDGITGSAIIGIGVCTVATFSAIILNMRGKKRAVSTRKKRRYC